MKIKRGKKLTRCGCKDSAIPLNAMHLFFLKCRQRL